MTGRLARRLLWAAALVFVVVSGSFFLVRWIPGGPFDGERALPPEIQANLERAYGLDLPLGEQYLLYLSRVARLDLGPSLSHLDYGVGEILADSLPVSLLLGGLALLLALLVGLPAGALAALRRGTAIDTFVMSVATVGIALPNFVLAGVLILLFVFHWTLFPVAGASSPAHLVLPSVALGLPLAATVARLFRAGLLETLGEDFVRTAHAKGLPPLAVLVRHVSRHAILPVVSFLGPAAAAVLTGSLVIEKIFAISGMGSHFVDSAFHADYNLALGAVLVYTALVALLNVVVDVVAMALDPRIDAL